MGEPSSPLLHVQYTTFEAFDFGFLAVEGRVDEGRVLTFSFSDGSVLCCSCLTEGVVALDLRVEWVLVLGVGCDGVWGAEDDAAAAAAAAALVRARVLIPGIL